MSRQNNRIVYFGTNFAFSDFSCENVIIEEIMTPMRTENFRSERRRGDPRGNPLMSQVENTLKNIINIGRNRVCDTIYCEDRFSKNPKFGAQKNTNCIRKLLIWKCPQCNRAPLASGCEWGPPPPSLKYMYSKISARSFGS